MILILLADGERVGTTGNIASDNAKGFYWSSTPFSNNNAYGLNFYEDLDYQFIHNYSNSNAYTVAPVREYITD